MCVMKNETIDRQTFECEADTIGSCEGDGSAVPLKDVLAFFVLLVFFKGFFLCSTKKVHWIMSLQSEHSCNVHSVKAYIFPSNELHAAVAVQIHDSVKPSGHKAFLSWPRECVHDGIEQICTTITAMEAL